MLVTLLSLPMLREPLERGVLFRLPPLQNIQPSITTEHSFGEEDVSYCHFERVGRSEYPGPATDIGSCHMVDHIQNHYFGPRGEEWNS